MLTRKHLWSVIKLGAPLMAGMVSEYFMYIADSAMVGRLGTTHLAAIGIATIFAEILWVIVWPFAPGTQALAARRFGRLQAAENVDAETKKSLYRKTGQILDNSLVISFSVGIITVLLASSSKQILELLLDNRQLIPLADSYISVIKYAMPLAGIFYSCYGFLAAINMTRVIMVGTVGINILNIGFNYILIFGKFGFPAMGMKGAAIGTLMAQALGVAFFIYYILGSKKTRIYHCGRFLSLKVRLMKDIFIASCPMIAQLVLVLSVILYYEAIIAGIGTIYLAVTHIIFTIFLLNHTLVEGFAEGGSILIGNHLGRGERKEAIQYAHATIYIAFFFGSLLMIVLLAFPESIVKIFNQEPETVALGVRGLRFFVVFVFINIVTYPLEIIFTHNGWGKFPLVAELFSIVTFALGLTLLLTQYFNMGIYAAWLSLGLYMVCYAVLLVGGFLSKHWLTVTVEKPTA